MLEGRHEHIATFSDFSEDFPRLPKISENFQNFRNLSECLYLHSSVLFPKFSKEFPNIQQRRHKLLLPVTDRPLNFFMYVIQLFSFNLKLVCTNDFFKKFKFNSHSGLIKF